MKKFHQEWTNHLNRWHKEVAPVLARMKKDEEYVKKTTVKNMQKLLQTENEVISELTKLFSTLKPAPPKSKNGNYLSIRKNETISCTDCCCIIMASYE